MASIDEFEDHCWQDVVPEADMWIYAPYARDTAVGPHAALLAIDLYNQSTTAGRSRRPSWRRNIRVAAASMRIAPLNRPNN